MFTYLTALFAVAGLIQTVSAQTNAAGVCSTVQTTVDCSAVQPTSLLWQTVPLNFDPATTEIILSETGMPVFHRDYVNLDGLSVLKKLTIGRCPSVAEITSDSFPVAGLGAITFLVLNNNAIAKIEDDAFVGVVSLQVLDLSGNALTEVTADTFSALINLQTLKLGNNALTGLGSGVFKYQTALNELDISFNKLASATVDNTAFSFTNPGNLANPANGMQSLTILRLDNNKFSAISQDSFKDLANLEKLFMEDNLLTSVDANAFATTPKLAYIDFGDNLFSTLDQTTFQWNALTTGSIHVNGKFWDCCQVPWLINATYAQSVSSTVCARPASAINSAIKDSAAVSAVATQCSQNEPATPTAPGETAKSPTSLSIEWAAVSGNAYAVHHYSVEYQKAGGDWSLKNVATCTNGQYPDESGNLANSAKPCEILAVVNSVILSKLAFQIADLAEFTTYDIRVVATSQYELDTSKQFTSANGASVALKTAEATPGAVASFVVSPAGSYAIVVDYTPPGQENGEITQYMLTITAQGTTSTVKHQQVCIGSNAGACAADMTHTFSGLTANTAYDITVTAETSVGPGAVATKTASTDEAPPAQPDSPTVQNISDATGSTFVNIEWVEPSASASNGAITDYAIYIDPEPADVGGAGKVPAGAGTKSKITGLEPSSQYTVTLTAWTGSGESARSVDLVVNTNQAAPDQQDPPSGKSLTASSFLATWKPPVVSNGRIIGYMFAYVQNGLNNTQYINTSAAEPYVQVLGLDAATSYTVKVLSYNSMASSVWSGNFTITTFESAPSDVSCSAVANGRDTVKVTWVPPALPNGVITSYQVYQVSESQYVKNYPAYENLDQVLLYNTTADETAFSHNFATAHMTYRYSVSACNSASCSPLNQIAQATTFEAVPVNQYAPTVKITGASEALLRWSKPQKPNGEIIKYEVHKEQYDDETPSFSGIPTDVTDGKLSITLVNLNPDTVYRFTVTSYTSQGPSERSAETPGTTQSQKPSSRIATLVAVLSIFVTILSIGFMWEHRLRRQNIDISPMNKQPLLSPFGDVHIPGDFSQEKQLNNPFDDTASVSSASSGSSSGSSFGGGDGYGEAEAGPF